MRGIILCVGLIFVSVLSLSAQCPWDTDQTIDPPQLTLGGPYILRCPGEAISINVTSDGSATSFSWSGPNGYTASTENITDVITGGTYTLTANYGAGCSETRSIAVTTKAGTPPAITLAADTITCRAGGEITFDLSITDPLASYQWSGPSGFSAGSIPNPTTAIPGDYRVIVRDRNNCDYNLSTTITIDTAKAEVVLQDIDLDCTSTSFTLEPTSLVEAHPGSAFRWIGTGGIVFSERTQVATARTPGTYTFRVTDRSNGCITNTSLTVNRNPDQPEFVLEQAVINCEQSADTFRVDLQGCATCQVEWTDPAGMVSSGLELPVSVAGKYSVQVENTMNQCVSAAETNLVFQTSPLRRTYRTTDVSCGDLPGQVELRFPQLYNSIEWRDSSASAVVFSEPVLDLDNPATIYAYSIDRNGCETYDTFRIDQSPAPELELLYSGDTLNCFGEPIAVGVDILNYSSSEIETYAWQLPDGTSSSAALLAVDQQGIFTLQVTTDMGCSSQLVEGQVPADFAVPQVEATGGYFSCSEGGLQIASTVQINPIDIQWSGPSNFWSNELTPTATRAGVYTLQITAENGCSNQDTALVTSQLQSLEPLMISSQNIDCISPEGFITIENIDPEFTYSWQDLTTPSLVGEFTGNTLPIPRAGLFAIEGFHAISDCVFLDTIEITDNQTRPVVTINPVGTIRCSETVITIESTVDALVDYIWSTTDGEIISPTSIANAEIDGAGLYRLEVVNGENNCRDTAVVQVDSEANDLTGLEIDMMQPDCYGANNGTIDIVNVEGGQGPFQFSIGGSAFSENTSFTNLDSSDYIIIAQDASGCTYEDTVRLDRIPSFEVNLSKDTSLRLGNPLTLSTQRKLQKPKSLIFFGISVRTTIVKTAPREIFFLSNQIRLSLGSNQIKVA